MLPPEMMQQPPQQQGPPPEMLAALMGGAGGGMGDPGMGMPPEPEPEPEMSPIDHLRQAIEHAQAALVAEPDDVDSQNLAAAVKQLYAILASRQKEHESLMGGGNLKALSRASQ